MQEPDEAHTHQSNRTSHLSSSLSCSYQASGFYLRLVQSGRIRIVPTNGPVGAPLDVGGRSRRRSWDSKHCLPLTWPLQISKQAAKAAECISVPSNPIGSKLHATWNKKAEVERERLVHASYPITKKAFEPSMPARAVRQSVPHFCNAGRVRCSFSSLSDGESSKDCTETSLPPSGNADFFWTNLGPTIQKFSKY